MTERSTAHVIRDELHFMKHGRRLWGLTDYYGAVIGAYDAVIAKDPWVGKVPLVTPKGFNGYIEDFVKAYVIKPRPHHCKSEVALIGNTAVRWDFVLIVEAMVTAAVGGTMQDVGTVAEWRSSNAYSPVWYVIGDEPLGIILPLYPRGIGQA